MLRIHNAFMRRLGNDGRSSSGGNGSGFDRFRLSIVRSRFNLGLLCLGTKDTGGKGLFRIVCWWSTWFYRSRLGAKNTGGKTLFLAVRNAACWRDERGCHHLVLLIHWIMPNPLYNIQTRHTVYYTQRGIHQKPLIGRAAVRL